VSSFLEDGISLSSKDGFQLPDLHFPAFTPHELTTAMVKYFTGPTNAAVLIGIVVTLCIVTGILVIWRLAFRFSRRTLGLSDLLLSIALVIMISSFPL
jgi:cytochrome b subunit of formate dehydrogenase